MIAVSNLRLQFGKKIIFTDGSFRVEDGEKVGIVGVNGSGKTTLLRIISSEIKPDDGDVTISKGSTIGYLPQEAILDSEITLYEELSQVFSHLKAYQSELKEIEDKISRIDQESDGWKQLSKRWDFLHNELHRLGAYNLDSQIKKIAKGLGFSDGDFERPCSEFSGGWQMRVLLAKILLQNPSILLLDEPTNHLDLETMIWLEEWISQSKSDVVMVSHERAFMDKLVSKIMELERGNLTLYKGNYSSYLEQRKERREHHRRAWENQQQEINQIKRFIEKFRANASRAALVQSRIKQLKKIEIIPPPPTYEDTIHFKFPKPIRSNKEVVTLSNLTKRFCDKVVLDKIDLTIYRGDRIALLGVNGAGKSTLIKILAGEEELSEGKRIVGNQVVIEYFTQYQQESLNPENDVLQELGSAAPPEFTSELRNLLGAFLFRDDDVFKRISVLSGGEKTRLRLAKMLYSRANLLLLDEPTNHLDIASRRTLENALQNFTGTIVFVSHDRYFIDKIANKVIEISDGKIKTYPGNYSDYIRARKAFEKDSVEKLIPELDITERELQSQNKDQIKATETSITASALPGFTPSPKKTKEQKRIEAEMRNKISAQRQSLTVLIQRLEEEIELIENRLQEINTLLADSSFYSKKEEISFIISEKKEIEEKLPTLLNKWESSQKELSVLLNSIRG